MNLPIPSVILPSQPVTLSVEQINDLNEKLSDTRHDINGQLSVIGAALELIRHKPQTTERMLATLAAQPNKIKDTVERVFGDWEPAPRRSPIRLRPPVSPIRDHLVSEKVQTHIGIAFDS
ncbi:MAG: hypothetical protein NT154_02310, partial [Verrucomicrobia bacterium]|nr:hypothetical protein [Verrucomicrobiota bacterium]